MIRKWLFLGIVLFITSACGSGSIATPQPGQPDPKIPESNKGEVSIGLGIDEAGDFIVSGEYAYPIKAIKNIGGIYWAVGFETTLTDARNTQNYLYLVWEDDNDDVVVNQYDIGQQFDIRFSQQDWVRKLSHSGDGNLVVFVEKQIMIVETYGALSSSCPGAPPQNIIVGERAYVCTQSERVRVRSSAGVLGEELTRLVPGTNFKVIKGPRCADNWSWWRIRTSDGVVGWIAEGGDEKDSYFICHE